MGMGFSITPEIGWQCVIFSLDTIILGTIGQIRCEYQLLIQDKVMEIGFLKHNGQLCSFLICFLKELEVHCSEKIDFEKYMLK